MKEVFAVIEVTSMSESVVRLGRKNEGKPRPIKVKMGNPKGKDQIMCSLTKLKDGPEGFKRISITEDYTHEECLSIREKVKEAKRKTETEVDGKYVFKVRGTPKNGLTIRQFIIVNPASKELVSSIQIMYHVFKGKSRLIQ